jgi:hypothetical protein
MSEIIFIFFIMAIVALLAFTPLGYSILAYSKKVKPAAPAPIVPAATAKTVAEPVKPAAAVLNKTVVEIAKPAVAGLVVPEDSVLKRHFLAQLQSEIEATLFPRPTDATLQRHYDSMVASKVESLIYGG